MAAKITPNRTILPFLHLLLCVSLKMGVTLVLFRMCAVTERSTSLWLHQCPKPRRQRGSQPSGRTRGILLWSALLGLGRPLGRPLPLWALLKFR